MDRRQLKLTDEERLELEAVRDHEARAYLRERAAALLKVASGHSAVWVAREGLHKPRHPETILIWLNEYEETRHVRPRPATRGAFSPARPGP